MKDEGGGLCYAVGMRRRVSRISRVGLVLVGVALLFWLPISYFFMAGAYSPWPRACGFSSTHGAVYFYCHYEMPLPPGVTVTSRIPYPTTPNADFRSTKDFLHFEPFLIPRDAWIPRFDRLSVWNVAVLRIPLWLLAVVCLAWPVTSFVIARRRRGTRGFEVQTEVSGQKSEVSQSPEEGVEQTT
jgi:hypothetical protein